MTRASIRQTDDVVGFQWLTSHGEPATLAEVVAEPDSEPGRLLPTHLEALDDVLVGAVGRWGRVLGGGRPPDPTERVELDALQRVLDRLCMEYADALRASPARPDLRAGQIVGTAALVGRRARLALGRATPEPLAGQLDAPPVGVVSGYADLVLVDPDRPGLGARWVVRTEDGRRLPATLDMLLHDSSGVRREAALDEHRAALRAVVAAEGTTGADPSTWAASLEWLLDELVLAMRESRSSAAVTLRRFDDAGLIVSAAAAAARARAASG